ncbi:pirin family protein [Streptomyces sp. Amel2xB2]|uniref:pirin family protein n=1 Tax=Streptomyces sp. Amel2xB2 TaxID=1305829 RepID=UPI000DBA3449|nr:pirin family protein [Streptomyces sp. Amel2xB2]
MSNVETQPVERTVCDGPPPVPGEPDTELLEPREVPLGGPRGMLVRRSLPHRDRRMVGAWCFADSYGPEHIAGEAGMQVPPHPHTGLQTVSWLLEGEVLHQDSLGSRRTVRPGELNLMTAGAGIAHSEQSPPGHPDVLHGVQLWVALPERDRDGPAHFEHHAGLPAVREAAGTVTVLMGELAGAVSPARACTPLVGAEVALNGTGPLRLPLEPGFEHAVLALSGAPAADGHPVPPGAMLHLGRGRRELTLSAEEPARLMLLGGVPFDEPLVMWWNFVARSHEEIVEARAAWEAEREGDGDGGRFGAVTGYEGPALPAPQLPGVELRARPRYRARRPADG